MDPISHTLLARAGTGLDRARVLGPGSRAAAMLGALAPDVDFVAVFWGWDRYLVLHETGTHTLAAAPALAMAVGLAIRLFVRDSKLRGLWMSAFAGVVLGHLAFDLVSGSDMRLLAPFSRARFGPHWFAMADVLLIAVLLGGAFWGVRHRHRVAIWTLVAIAAFASAKVVSKRAAIAAIAQNRSAAASAVSAHPAAVNGSFFEWRAFDREASAIRAWRVDVRTGRVRLEFQHSAAPASGAVTASLDVPAVRRFLALAHLPFPRIETMESRRFVLWSDVADCRAAGCDLSFGAELDSADRPIREVIRIGPIEQTRPIVQANVE